MKKEKRIVSVLLLILLVCSVSQAAFAYSLSGNASITGDISKLNFSGRASTNCPISALDSSDGEFDIYQSGREIYNSFQHDKTSFSDSWQIKSPEMELYECAMTGNFFYTNLPADKKTWTASKDLRVMRSGITGEQAIYEIDDGFKEYLSKFFEIKEASYHFVQRYSDEFSTLNLVETDIFIDRRIGDTKPVYLINTEGEELLILKQDIKGVNYKFSFSFKNGQYTLEETEQKQGKFIDGKELLK